jgi:hypothetical protein
MSSEAFASATERSSAGLRVRTAWIVASLIPAVFVLFFFALTFLTAPEHDDYCMASRYLGDGLVQTVIGLYFELSGRVVPFALIQLPAAIAWGTGSGLLSAYSLTMATIALVFLVGTAVAIARAGPHVRGFPLVFLAFALAAATIGASPSVRDLLYWLPAVACYVPPALASILILGECVRALDRESQFSPLAVSGLAIVGFIGSLCNEYTGVWLLVIVASSLFARRVFGDKLQIAHHTVIAGAILSGWLIAVLAKGNSMRMGGLKGAGNLARSLGEGLNFSLVGLEQFIREPVIIGWFVVVIAVTLAEPEPVRPARLRRGLLALGVAVICLACAYFEYFTHEYSTGIRLVERAQNQALVLVLFGLTLSVSLLVRAYRPRLRALPVLAQGVLTLDSPALPAALTVVMAVSILLSSTASLVRAEGSSLYPYWRESVERDRLLSTSPEKIVTVLKHRWTPSLLMTADMNVAPGCVAGYYGKSEVIAIDPPSR